MSFFTTLKSTLSSFIHPAEAAFKSAFSAFVTSSQFDKIKQFIVMHETAYLAGLYDKIGRNNAVLKAVKSVMPNLPEETAQFIIDTLVGLYNGKLGSPAKPAATAAASAPAPAPAPVAVPTPVPVASLQASVFSVVSETPGES
jgi:hypothetical protein